MPKKVASTLGMSRDEWLHIRRGYIGGSDAATCMDDNPWSDKLTLYCDKKEMRPDREDNFPMKIGRDTEDLVAKYFMEETGKKVRNDNSMWISDEYPFMGADIDRTVVGENAALECKTTSSFAYDIENGDIPPQYYWQVQHYIAVMNYDYMYIAFIHFVKRAFYWFKIERNDEHIAQLIEAEKDFWENYVLANVFPEANGSDSSLSTLQLLHPHDNGMATNLNTMDEYHARKYIELGDAVKRLKKEQDECKARLQESIGDYSLGGSNLYKVSWKEQARTSVDAKRLKQELEQIHRSDIYEKVVKSSTSRVMSVSKKKLKKGEK